MKIVLSSVEIEIIQGNIAAQQGITAVVNAANARLLPGGGVAGAIHNAAGPGLAEECKTLAPIKPGEAVISGGHNLPNKYVIHCLGPVYGVNEPAAELLANCYRNALKLAEEYKIDSIAFPAISTGIFGYPMEEAAKTAFAAIADLASGLNTVKIIRFVLFDRISCEVHEKALQNLMKQS